MMRRRSSESVYAPGDARTPGHSSSVTHAPPTISRRSSTRTSRPARARYAAHTRPLWPAPTMTTSRMARERTTSGRAQQARQQAAARSGHVAGDAPLADRQAGGDVDLLVAEGVLVHAEQRLAAGGPRPGTLGVLFAHPQAARAGSSTPSSSSRAGTIVVSSSARSARPVAASTASSPSANVNGLR